MSAAQSSDDDEKEEDDEEDEEEEEEEDEEEEEEEDEEEGTKIFIEIILPLFISLLHFLWARIFDCATSISYNHLCCAATAAGM